MQVFSTAWYTACHNHIIWQRNSVAAEKLSWALEGMSWPFYTTDIQQWIKHFEKSIWLHIVWELQEKERALEPERRQKTSKNMACISCTQVLQSFRDPVSEDFLP